MDVSMSQLQSFCDHVACIDVGTCAAGPDGRFAVDAYPSGLRSAEILTWNSIAAAGRMQ